MKLSFPSFSVGLPRKPNVLNPDTRNTIGSPHKTPEPSRYNIPLDNIYYNKNQVNHTFYEKKFFTPTNMPSIRQVVPI